jgi:hypothetical protein
MQTTKHELLSAGRPALTPAALPAASLAKAD